MSDTNAMLAMNNKKKGKVDEPITSPFHSPRRSCNLPYKGVKGIMGIDTVKSIALFGVLILGAYLTGVHWGAHTVACPTNGLINCNAVLTGPGSVVIGLPLAAWGALWALSGFFLLRRTERIWLAFGVAGLLWAWLHEIIDGHLCLWCSAMQLLIILAIVMSSIRLRTRS